MLSNMVQHDWLPGILLGEGRNERKRKWKGLHGVYFPVFIWAALGIESRGPGMPGTHSTTLHVSHILPLCCCHRCLVFDTGSCYLCSSGWPGALNPPTSPASPNPNLLKVFWHVSLYAYFLCYNELTPDFPSYSASDDD
jgi:hypothetical protein